MAGVPRFKGASGKGAGGGIGKALGDYAMNQKKRLDEHGTLDLGIAPKLGPLFPSDKAEAAKSSGTKRATGAGRTGEVGSKPVAPIKSAMMSASLKKPATGVSSGTGPKASPSYKKSQKAAGDAYLASSSTDYGVGSAVNSFVNKPKKR